MTEETLKFVVKHFQALSGIELYQLLQLRSLVFVVEQKCAYLDCDGKDLDAMHMMGFINEKLVATTRILAPGVSYPGYASIGRVANHPSVRGKGIGKSMMEESIKLTRSLYPDAPIKIGAQAYLRTFYSNLGFQDINQPYLEDDIPHLIMIWNGV